MGKISFIMSVHLLCLDICKSSHRPPYSFYVVPFDFFNLLTCALFALDTSALFERDYGIDCSVSKLCFTVTC